jgi:hypothetical protein
MWREAWVPHRHISRTSFAELKESRCMDTSRSCGSPEPSSSFQTPPISRRSRSPWGSPATVILRPPFGEASVALLLSFVSQRAARSSASRRAWFPDSRSNAPHCSIQIRYQIVGILQAEATFRVELLLVQRSAAPFRNRGAADLEAYWPTGLRQTVKGLKANQPITIREGVGVVPSKGWEE